jgi:hypothetical protein
MDENEINRKVASLKQFENVDLVKVAADRGLEFQSLPVEIKALLVDAVQEGYASGIYEAS